MTHDQIQELMLIYAAGAADPDERAAAEQLLSNGNVVAQGAYAEAVAVVSTIPLSLNPIIPPKSVRDGLLLRVAADVSTGGVRPTLKPQSTPRGPVLAAWFAGALAASLALALTLTLVQNRNMRTQYQHLQDRFAASNELDSGIRNVVSSPHVRLAKLTYENRPDGGGPGARMMYCPVSKQYQLVVYRVSPPPPGRVYELWLITDQGQKMPAGTFTVDEKGNASHYFKAPRDVQIASAAVTDEPECGVTDPTGVVHLVGELR